MIKPFRVRYEKFITTFTIFYNFFKFFTNFTHFAQTFIVYEDRKSFPAWQIIMIAVIFSIKCFVLLPFFCVTKGELVNNMVLTGVLVFLAFDFMRDFMLLWSWKFWRIKSKKVWAWLWHWTMAVGKIICNIKKKLWKIWIFFTELNSAAKGIY